MTATEALVVAEKYWPHKDQPVPMWFIDALIEAVERYKDQTAWDGYDSYG